jgi:tetratricopeptide (TPR) repeat protein
MAQMLGSVRTRRTWALTLAIVTIGLVAGGTMWHLVRSRMKANPTEWAEIERLARAKRWAHLRPKLERFIGSHPEHGESRVLLADVELRDNRRDAAVELLRAVRAEDPSWSRAQMVLGRLAVMERRADDAERIFRGIADRDARATEARRDLVYLLSLQMRTAGTRAALWELYHIDEDLHVLVDLVLEVLTDPDVRGLGPELELLVARTPDDPLLLRAWGMSLLYQGRAEEALPCLEAAASSLVNDPAGRFALAECLLVLGRSFDAAEILGPVPEQSVDASQWWLYRGRLEEATGQPERAIASLERGTGLNPRNREAHFRLGEALDRCGRADPARQHLEQARRIEDSLNAVRREHRHIRRSRLQWDPDDFARFGGLCADAGLIDEACAWLEQALKLDPSREDLTARLTQLRASTERLPIALADPRPAATGLASSRPGGKPSIAGSKARAEPPGAAAPPFEEGSEAAGLKYFYESGAGGDRLFIADTMGGGVGLIDFDRDGWLDVYLVNGCRLPFDAKDPPRPNVLYRNQRDGTFRDVTAMAGVGGRGYGMGCVVGDYDNDGDDDLFVTGFKGTILYLNRGDGTFEDVTASAGVFTDAWSTAAGFGDLDGDGDLDLVVVTYLDVAQDDGRLCRDNAGHPIHCTPTVYRPQADLLYRNNGDGTFAEVGRAVGFLDKGGRGLGLAIADLDDDGKLDIFVANDATPNFLYRNRGGWRFEEVGVEAGVGTNGSGRATASMGVVADDLDGDGRIDLFITNLVNESNTFHRNLGGMQFIDATLGAGLDAPSRPRTGFGDAALDADNDGRLDLFVANGHVDHRPWANSPMAQTPQFFWGRDSGHFALAGRAGSSFDYFSRAVVGRGVAAGDLNNDGRVDLVVIHRDAPAVLLWNRAEGGHWLGLQLRGTRSGRTPVGARVTCRAGARTIVRWLTSGTGYLSAHDPRLWLGLGSAARVDRLEIRWPSEAIQSWTDLPADRVLAIEEGIQEIGGGTSKRRVDRASLQ